MTSSDVDVRLTSSLSSRLCRRRTSAYSCSLQRAARYALPLVVVLAFEVWQHRGVPPRGLLVALLIGGAVGITLIE